MTTRSLLDKTLLFASQLARRHTNAVLAVSLVLFVLSLLGAGTFLEFQTSRDDLISSQDELYETQTNFLSEFPSADDVVVMVEGGDAQKRERFVQLLTKLLADRPELFDDVFPYLELPFLQDQTLMFLSEQELTALVKAVDEAKPFLQSLDSPHGLASLLGDFDQGLAGREEEKLAAMLPFLVEVLEELRRSVNSRGREPYRSPWGDVLFPNGDPQLAEAASGGLGDKRFYHTLTGARVHLLMLRLKNRDAETIAELRRISDTAARAFPDLMVGLTGEPLLEHDEMVSSEQDSHRSAVLSLVLVGLLFAIAFRQVTRPMAAIFCLVLSVGWTVGFTTVVIGHLNLLTISFATILIGLGIDFGIHLLFRYEEEFLKCGETDIALDQALLGTGSDITVGAFSTATAFWAVGLTDFKGVSEIGIIAGGGVILCLLATLLVLPALIAKMDRNRTYQPGESIPLGSRILMAKTENEALKRAPWILAVVALFFLWAAPTIWSVGFDYNLLRLQDPTLESVKTEMELIEKGGKTVLFSVALADNIEHANQLKATYEKLPSVSRVESISELFPERTPTKVKLLRELRDTVQGLKVASAGDNLGGKDLERLGEGFQALEGLFSANKEKLLNHSSPRVRESAARFEQQLDLLFKELSVIGPGPIEDGLTAFQTSFFADLEGMVAFLQAQNPDHELALSDLPRNLATRSIGQTGKLVLRIYPTENIWEREALQTFVSQVREAEPSTIGAPVMIWHHTNILKGAFESSAVYALVAVTVMLLLYFRSLKWTLLALMPLGMGIMFMLFVMGRYGVSFNPANFMGLPLLLGIGLDFGIHVLHRTKEEKRVNMFDHSTGPATAVSALTTICGFGTLALGGHQGVASLGFILAAGVSGIMISALVILPAILKVWSPFAGEKATPEPVVEQEERRELSA